MAVEEKEKKKRTPTVKQPSQVIDTLWDKEDAAKFFTVPISTFNLLFSQGEYEGCYYYQGRKVTFVPDLCRALAKKKCGKAS